MRVACPHCRAEYDVDETRIPPAGLKVRCPKCQQVFPVRKGAPAAAKKAPERAPEKTMAGQPTPPSPGVTRVPRAGPAPSATTVVGTPPATPATTLAGRPPPQQAASSVPLPGGAPPAPPQATLVGPPGGSTLAGVPLPAPPSPPARDGGAASSEGAAVPLPGGRPGATLAGQAPPPGATVVGIPPPFPPAREPGGAGAPVRLPGSPRPGATPAGTPPPGSTLVGSPFPPDSSGAAPLSGATWIGGPPPPAAEFRPAEGAGEVPVPLPGTPGEGVVVPDEPGPVPLPGAPPPRAAVPPPEAPPAEAGAAVALPPPPEAPLGFGEVPAAEGEMLPEEELWPQLEETPPAVEAAHSEEEAGPSGDAPGSADPVESFSFGSLGSGEPSAPAEPEPTAAPPPEEPPVAEPPPPAGGGEDDLEALFGQPAPEPERRPPPRIDGVSFKVRRPSGKVFGPFAEHDVVEMLGKGELLGNEDVSPDGGATWTSIGAVPALAAAVRRLQEAPLPGQTQGARDSSRIPLPFKPKSESGLKARGPRIPLPPRKVALAAGGALAALVVGTGIAGSFTSYGPFFWKALVGHSANPAVARLVAEGRTALAEDSFPGDQRASSLAEQALRTDSFDPQARLLLALAAGSLAPRGSDQALARARDLANELAGRAPKSLEARGAVLAVRLGGGEDVGAALALLEGTSKADADPELVLLMGRAAASRSDWRKAASFLDRFEVLRPHSSRAARAKALLAVQKGDDKAARPLFEAALSRDPGNVSAALDLAMLMDRTGDAAAEAALRFLLDKDRWAKLGPAERGRVHLALAQLLSRKPGGDAWAPAIQAELEAAVEAQPALIAPRVLLGRLLIRRGAAAKAVEVLKPVAAAARDRDLLALYARALVLAGNLGEAKSAVDAALSRSPDEARTLFLKGWLEQQSGDRAAARKLYERAVERAPSDWVPKLALGELALAEGDLARAGSLLPALAEKEPNQAEVQAGLGDWKLAQKDPAGAEAAYRKALELDPDCAAAMVGKVRVALGRGDTSTAREQLTRALQIDPLRADAQLLVGWLLWSQGDAEGGRKAVEAAVALDPKSSLAQARLGAICLEQGQTDEAMRRFELATSLDAGNAEAQFGLGRTLLVKGDAKQALERLQKAAALGPEDPNHHLFLGLAYERAGQPREAAEAYRAAIAAGPALPDGYERLAQLLASQGDFQGASVELEKALKAAPRMERLRVELGDAKEHLGKHSEAIALYRLALQRDPKLVSVPLKIAQAVHAGQGLRAAVPYYEQAAKVDPANAMPHLYLGYAYKERGDRSRARQEFKTYLKQRPDADDRKDVELEIEDLGP